MSSKANISIRAYRPSDPQALLTLFGTSVHGLAQRLAWAPLETERPAGQVRQAMLPVRRAQHWGQPAGFIGFTTNAHIELMFCSPACARQGLASALHRDAEVHLRTLGAAALFTAASLKARPCFARQGFSVEQAQTLVRGTVTLQRFAMRRPLRPERQGTPE
ncbi:GNAT family N-acetyltransferase [Pseudomonas sp.]|uniref:GNAT family N-acetyltransferase n=1 Tax=Pseudomonas sp. TaxID=306 RepID=UPI0026191930|nr:GNAT family N-acetyltransferase [Pseudomonas sp.]